MKLGMRAARAWASALVAMALWSVSFLAAAAALTIGNIIVSGSPSTINEFTPAGTLVQNLPNPGSGAYTTGMCFEASGNLLVTRFDSGAIALYNGSTGALSNAAFITASGSPEACVRDAGGNFYVTSVGAVAAIRKYSAAGALLQSFLPGQRSDWLDLAADNCTMYWDDEGATPQIHRFNVCTGTALTDLGGSSTYTALRVLPGSGDIIVANDTTGRVDRFSPSGTLLGSWTPTGLLGTLFSLNLDPDGATFWTAGTSGSVHRFALSGFAPQIGSFNTGQTVFGVTVVGEITAAPPTPPPPVAILPVPTMSEWMLAVLAMLLAGMSAWRLRRRG